MSGPAPVPAPPEILPGRSSRVGGVDVRRVLPTRPRRMVGAWCFADHFGPTGSGPGTGMNVGPHPHVGLQTVTWLVEGEVLHRDSLGNEQLIRPGQLNLMTAGHGVSHSEETVVDDPGVLHGLQLWVAQPDGTRHAAPAFEHHGELPVVDLGPGSATVLVGSFAGASSPARRDSDHFGAELDLGPGVTTFAVRPDSEHAVVVLSGRAHVGDEAVVPGTLAQLGPGRDALELRVPEAARAVLLGGVPFEQPVLMWWNYVGRTHDEISAAHTDWSSRSDRFGAVSSPLPRIETGRPPWEMQGSAGP